MSSLYVCPVEEVPEADYVIPLSKAEVIKEGLSMVSNFTINPFLPFFFLSYLSLSLFLPFISYILWLFLLLSSSVGSDVTLISYGAQLHILRQALLKAEEELGISCELIDLRTILPWDAETVVQVNNVLFDLNYLTFTGIQ